MPEDIPDISAQQFGRADAWLMQPCRLLVTPAPPAAAAPRNAAASTGHFLVEEATKMSAIQKTGIGAGAVVCLMLALVVGMLLGGLRDTVAPPAWAAEMGPARYGQEGIRVSGTAVVRAAPDLATVRLGYESRDRRARAAKVANDAVMKKVIAAIVKQGVERKDIQTVEYRVFPVWEWQTTNTRALFWHVLHMVEVRVRKVDTVTDVIDAASAAGADKVENVEFTVDNLHKLRGKAREMAAKVARDKAEQLAELMGAQVGELIAISDNAPEYEYWWWNRTHANVAAQVSADEPSTVSVEAEAVVSAGQIMVRAREEVVFALGR